MNKPEITPPSNSNHFPDGTPRGPRSESGTLCYIQGARILALRLDAFDKAWFASNHATQNTTSASKHDVLTLSATPLALQHAIIAIGAYNTASTTVSGYLNVARDGTTVEEWNREAPNAAGLAIAVLQLEATPRRRIMALA